MKKLVMMVLGANRGIGLAIAKALYADEKYCLSLGIRDISSTSLDTIFSDKSRVSIHRYDAKDTNTAKTWVNATLNYFGSIDGVINCAGIFHLCGIENYDEKKFDEVWQVNAKAPVILVNEAWKFLQQSGKGRIINIDSLSGKVTNADEFAYSMSKHALLAFTHSIRQAGWKYGIRVSAICPGWVNTDMAKGSCSLSPEHMTQPSDIANLVKTLLELPNNASIAELVINAECDQLY